MPYQIILDLSRLVYAAWSRNPTGIPRVELAYAQHLLATESDHLQFAVMDALGRLCLVDRAQAVAFIREIAEFWRSGVASRRAHWRLMQRALRLHATLLSRPRAGLRRHSASFAGRTVYIVVSQLHLERRRLIERLKRAGDVRLVYFIHDVIPSQYPEYFVPKDAARNRRRMTNAARLADAIVTNSEATRREFVALFGSPEIAGQIHVAPLGIARPLLTNPSVAAPAVAAARPYFVCLGTIEPRKNHLLLLNLWRRMVEQRGADAPQLVLIGGRGWENENIVDMLERSTSLRAVVEERNFVADEVLAQTLAGARALLLPSFAEGYGLPLAEALASGVPALCSDLPALREVGGEVPEYLDPLDGPAWQEAILAYAAEGSPRRAAQLERLKQWRRPSWDAHFGIVDAIVDRLAH